MAHIRSHVRKRSIYTQYLFFHNSFCRVCFARIAGVVDTLCANTLAGGRRGHTYPDINRVAAMPRICSATVRDACALFAAPLHSVRRAPSIEYVYVRGGSCMRGSTDEATSQNPLSSSKGHLARFVTVFPTCPRPVLGPAGPHPPANRSTDC